jgi:hypothetical protein
MAAVLILGSGVPVFAFPPAPPHEIYGMVRGEDGEPMSQSSVSIVLETDGNIQVSGNVVPNLEPGINYRLVVPMDSGVTADPYLDNALKSNVPFLISVVIGPTTYLPLEMTGDFSHLGEPGKSTRIDLTLGVDSDGDGLPDAWENILIELLGGGLTLADITPGGDSDHDGMSNYSEYIAGTYAFDSQDVFKLDLQDSPPETMVFNFLAIKGRTYEIQGSSNLTDWVSVPFVVPLAGTNTIGSYSASDVRVLEVEVPSTNSTTYYRGIVQ